MAINYTWEFPQFDVVKAEDGLTDVVKTIHWRYNAVDGEHSATAYGTIDAGAPTPGNFIPFDQLTKQWAIDKVTEVVNVAEMEAALAKAIQDQINPPIVPMAPPF